MEDAGRAGRPPGGDRQPTTVFDRDAAPSRAVSGSLSRVIPSLGEGVRIGRASDADIVVDDLLVSRHHALLRRSDEDGWELVDTGSANGTYVNGRRIERARLEPLDVVAVGHHMFLLVGDGLEEYIDQGSVSFRAEGLTVRTSRGQTLLDDVSFGLEERSFIAVVGPSGAGKSTLLNALTGFRPAEKGSVLYDGRDLYSSYDELRLRLGFVPQEDVLHSELTARQALGYAAELRFPADTNREERESRVTEVIGELGLANADAVAVRRLSGGQRRRVAVGLELITKPSLLFLDEPTSGLDPGYERALMELLRRLANGGRTIVVVTHSVQSIRLCDRVLFLAPGGHTAYFGPPQLATAYFEREDFQEVFQLLSSGGERDWGGAFRSHPYYERFVERPRPTAEEPGPAEPVPDAEGGRMRPSQTGSPARPRGIPAQLSLLTRRYTRVIGGDRRNLTLLCLQPVVLGLLMLAALPAGELAAPDAGEFRAVSRAGLVLLVLVLGTTWIGASNAVREIAKELPIVRRERAAGLSSVAYVGSKCVVLGALTATQCTAMALIALARQGSHGSGAVLSSPLVELVVVAVMAGLAGMALGLLISALVATVDRAMTVLPVVLLLQLLLALGAIFPDVVEKPGLKQASYIAGAQWGLSASASTVDLDRLQSIEKVAREIPTARLDAPLETFRHVADRLSTDVRWKHDEQTWLLDIGALALLTLGAASGAALAVHRRRAEA